MFNVGLKTEDVHFCYQITTIMLRRWLILSPLYCRFASSNDLSDWIYDCSENGTRILSSLIF